MTDTGLAERLLRRDRMIVAMLLLVLFVLAGLYTLFGVGMEMSAIEMTGMGGTEQMPAMPGDMPSTRDMPGMNDMPGAPEGAGAAEPPTMPGQGMVQGMEMGGAAGGWSVGYALLVFLMWWVMMIAMMLPSVAPVVLLYAALGRRGVAAQAVPRRAAAFVAGYLLIWGVFSAIAAFAQWTLERQGLVSMMTLTGSTAGALLLIAAGVFQFTPLKQSCLNHCRAPAEFLTAHRRPGAIGALRMGISHGTYCLGCCWFLMALLFVGGIMNLYWIVGLALWVAAEKYLPRGDLVSKAAGALLILWGGAVLMGVL
ncbi:hypothetical protein AYJ57_04465 [Salipiger sp. CCB-MM3]|uniref:DUF2182 domain-containing protein n=1 Tax=Salipiger sp. CCB-MM3 TaxID=1792508 RepID=UPI00080A9E67|nr:DUF2182 domain-containing protein [Salipiger sp. CCB-MM3]ANT59686.1 hypothetical protein AYJ57_04465 [Salipiger sp. CCB-MM3]